MIPKHLFTKHSISMWDLSRVSCSPRPPARAGRRPWPGWPARCTCCSSRSRGSRPSPAPSPGSETHTRTWNKRDEVWSQTTRVSIKCKYPMSVSHFFAGNQLISIMFKPKTDGNFLRHIVLIKCRMCFIQNISQPCDTVVKRELSLWCETIQAPGGRKYLDIRIFL